MATKSKKTNSMVDKKVGKAKKMGKRLLLLALVVLVLWVVTLIFAPSEVEYKPGTTTYIAGLELPANPNGEPVITHSGYSLLYSEEHEQPLWVAYHLTQEELYGTDSRKDNFRADPSIATGSATLADYKGSGYDRGHLAPAADFSWSEEAMSDSFFLSNMSPQAPDFNRGIWSTLEATVRNFADTEGDIYVVTGPVLTDGPYKTIGTNKVSVPKQYYKVILDYTEPELKAIGFVLPNEGSNARVETFATSVRQVEQLTNLDFFPKLPDPVEEKLETSFSVADWKFDSFQASAAQRQGFEKAEPTVQTKAHPLYTMAKGTLTKVLVMVKKQSLNLLDIFLPKSVMKQVQGIVS
ncbi:DNA/RNA non-specific endonuclease [Sphaerochaeta sp. PS]|uniref:DNA/RNA non-specific endonuclease n=1 Tax=Sphaerochaeta sp. PS TaxID=3076336 RepID=UPI0028A46478|nr:DNA/RNA non-specific endonuclease [Sphaerochaeta sp. PS]MDT4761243.1 DNA/RNA non-specific endonuclease [Sphaerochaeta sp. PS]